MDSHLRVVAQHSIRRLTCWEKGEKTASSTRVIVLHRGRGKPADLMAPERCCSGYGGLDALILSRSSATMHARITRKRLIAPVWMSLLAGSSPSGRRSVESERTLPEEWSCSKTQWMGRSLGGSLKGSPQGSWVSLACGQAWDFPVLTGLLRDYSTLDSSDHGRADPLWSSCAPVRTTCPTEIRREYQINAINMRRQQRQELAPWHYTTKGPVD